MMEITKLYGVEPGYSPDTTTPPKIIISPLLSIRFNLVFAAEFVIKINFQILPSFSRQFEGVSNSETVRKSPDNRSNSDAHAVGGVVSTVFFTKYFQGVGYGINEFINRIEKWELNDDYIIHLGSEFSRSAQSSGAGSDHGTDSPFTH